MQIPECVFIITSSFLCINANQRQIIPERLQEVIQVQLHPTTKCLKKEKLHSTSSIL